MNNHLLFANKEQLVAALSRGVRVKYLLFWGHSVSNHSRIAHECLSQWYPAEFTVDGINYPSAEHFMMAEKARLFHDETALQNILSSRQPAQAKQLGRLVKNYQEEAWKQHRMDIVIRGNLAKFSQNPPLKNYLLNTGNRILVEASPIDRIWGIGLDKHHRNAHNPGQWPGLNLLGFALMDCRHQISQY